VINYLWRILNMGPRRPGITDNVAHAPALHIVQGGVENGDKRWLEQAAGSERVAENWVAPKSAHVGDEVVVYVGGHGLFATARISSPPMPRSDWPNRHGAAIDLVRLIEPPISLEVLRRRMPEFQWTIYPRSITTPNKAIGEKLRAMIEDRRKGKGADLEEEELRESSLEELRAAALAKASKSATARHRVVIERRREVAIKTYALRRADGCCEFCREDAPFRTESGQPYLESHHILRLADSGPDHPENVIGVCPNCHRRAHFAENRHKIKDQMRRRVRNIEARRLA
jgi:5-methylcytosine-specific restriction endonuclease McrA